MALSVSELVNRFRDEMNKTTVYRILERMEDEGEVHSFIGKNGLRWYAPCKSCTSSYHVDTHPHFQCRVCGRTECLTMEINLPNVSSHKVDYAELLLVGLCETCLSKQ